MEKIWNGSAVAKNYLIASTTEKAFPYKQVSVLAQPGSANQYG